ncbi:MAG TPA: DM13 domain-containing protein [Thermosynechococcaceae cyanobacterium]
MKFKYLVSLCLASALLVSCAGKVANESSKSTEIDKTDNSAEAPSPATPAQTAALIAGKSGNFASGEHETRGKVRLVTENGKRFLELDATFNTSTSGPDLYVILHRSGDVLKATKPPAYPLEAQDYAIVDRLQKYNGAQRYAIPNAIKLENYQSVVIWCRMYNATFGTAKLSG